MIFLPLVVATVLHLCVNFSVNHSRIKWITLDFDCVSACRQCTADVAGRVKVQLPYHRVSELYTMSVNKKSTRSNSVESSDNGFSVITDKLDVLLKEISDLRIESKEMAKSIECTHDKIDDLTKLVQKHDDAIKNCERSIDNVKSENTYLRRQVDELKADLNNMHQYSRANCVDITGVPMLREENIMNIVQAVARVVHFELKPEMVDAVHRLGRRGSPSRPPGVIIKFVRRIDMDEFLRLAKVKSGFAASDLGFVSENRVFIRPSMSPGNRDLFSLARSIARDHDYKYVWFSNGRILMRKMEGTAVIHVTSKVQVLKLVQEGRRGDGDAREDNTTQP